MLLKYDDFIINEGIISKVKSNVYKFGEKMGFSEKEIDDRFKKSFKSGNLIKLLGIGVISYAVYRLIKPLINNLENLEKKEEKLKKQYIKTSDLKERERIIDEIKKIEIQKNKLKEKAKYIKEKN